MTAGKGIPFVDLVAPHLELQEQLMDAVKGVLTTGMFVGGPMVEQFEQEFGAYAIDLKAPLSSEDPRRRGFIFFQTPDKRPVKSDLRLTLSVERLPQAASIELN